MSKKKSKFIKIIDDTVKMPAKSGNGTLKILVNVDEQGKLGHYSLTYINPHIYSADNGRVLGYDNSHGYHHRHYMGKVEPVEFSRYEAIAEQFDNEWRTLHEKIKKHNH